MDSRWRVVASRWRHEREGRIYSRSVPRALATGCFAALATACGSSDVALLEAPDASATTESFAFDFAVYEIDTFSPGQKGAAVEHALVAVDLPTGERRDLTTTSNGRVRIEVPADASWITWTAAKPGYYPVTTFYRARLEHIRAQIEEDGELYALVEELPVPEQPATVKLTVTWPFSACVSIGLQTWCNPPEVGPKYIAQSSQPFLVSWFSRDEQGKPVERGEVTLSDTLTDQSLSLFLDGSDPTEVSTFDMTLLIPSDPASPLATEGVFVVSGMPVVVNDHSVGRNRGMAFDQHGDTGSGVLDLRVGYFATEGEDLDVDLRVYPAPGDSHVRWTNAMSGRSFPALPSESSYRMLDIPRLISPVGAQLGAPTRESSFVWQDIEGARMYELHVQKYWSNELGVRTLWLAVAWENQEISLPAPPSGYDPASEWGSLEGGEFRAAACDQWLPWSFRRLWAPPRAPAEVGCSFSEAVDGAVY